MIAKSGHCQRVRNLHGLRKQAPRPAQFACTHLRSTTQSTHLHSEHCTRGTSSTHTHTPKKKINHITCAHTSTAQHERVQCKPVASALYTALARQPPASPWPLLVASCTSRSTSSPSELADNNDKKNRLEKTDLKTCSRKPVASAATRQFEQWGLVPR